MKSFNPQNSALTSDPRPALVEFKKFLKDSGISPVSGWRLRKRGWLKTERIGRRLFITGESIEEFIRRARAGEFASTPVVPAPRKR
jgi:hypothetical protein